MKTFTTILFILFIFAFVDTGWSQEGIPWTTEVFKIRYAKLDDVAKVVGMFGGKMTTSEDLHVITWTGPPELLPGIARAVEQLDVPPPPVPNVEFTFYFLSASKGSSLKDGVPADLKSVTEQLKQVFGYNSFSLMDSSLLRASEHAKINGLLRLPATQQTADYDLELGDIVVRPGERSNSISLSLYFTARVPASVHAGALLRTHIEFQDGQKAVVGKTNIDGSSDTFFLIVTGHVVSDGAPTVEEEK